MTTQPRIWWKADRERVHEVLLDYVHQVETRQADTFDRFCMLESMYDPNGPAAEAADPRWRQDLKRITENVIASTVDTVCSAISTTEVRARFMTDGADWSTQRRAKLLELYAEEIGKLTGIAQACEAGFGEAAKKGTGINKIYADASGVPRVEPVMVDNIVVDDAETQNGAPPRQLHYRQVDYDRDQLIHQFPEYREEIDRACSTGNGWRRRWARWSVPGRESRNDVFVVESWILPLGNDPEAKGYIPGRHVICIDGCDLLDEEWHRDHFPFASMRWSKRTGSWYGISLAERILGHQRTLNKRNWQRDKTLDLLAIPTTYVRPADSNLRVQTTQIGNVVPVKGDYPLTVVPTVVGNEILADRHDAKASAYEETGVSRMSATAQKPAGLESGAAMREYKDQNTQRFSHQEKAFERFVLDTYVLTLEVCKDLGDDAPVMSKQSRFRQRKVRWKDVAMNDVRTMIAAASTLNRTPAGRMQLVLEFAQAGVISQDEARRLIAHPDLEQALSLYTAAMEAIEEDLELIEDGEIVVPEPFINLEMAVWRGQQRYLIDRAAGAPEEVLEGLRTYVVQAADLVSRKQAAAAPPGMMMPGLPSPMPMSPAMAAPQQMPSAGPPMLPAGTGPAPM